MYRLQSSRSYLALLTSILLLLSMTFTISSFYPASFQEKRILKVRFSNIEKLTVGAPVLFAGNPIGAVAEIIPLIENVDKKLGHRGIIYPYELSLAIDPTVPVYNVDEITIVNGGTLEKVVKMVEITPLIAKPGKEYALITDEFVYGRSAQSLETLLGEIAETSKPFKKVLQAVLNTQLIEKMGKAVEHMSDIGEALNDPEAWSSFVTNISVFFDRLVSSWSDVDEFLKNITAISEKVHQGEGSLGQLLMQDALYKNFYGSTNNLQAITDQILSGQGSLGQLLMQDTLYKNFYGSTNNLQAITDKILSGHGMLGKILMTDETYLKANVLMNKADVILNDVNHYGVLFHLNKSWQRARARRINLLQRLQTAQEFSNYFNDELSEIFTSLHRVGMVLQSAEDNCAPFNPCALHQVLQELLLQVNALQEEVRSYNIQTFEE